MRISQIGILTCLLITPFCQASAQQFRSDEYREAREHGWMFDYAKAKALARETNRPMMVVFRCVP